MKQGRLSIEQFVARLRVGNLLVGNLLRRRLLTRRLVVRFVCYHIVIKSLSNCDLFGLTPHGLGCYVLSVRPWGSQD
jgi:hypothetical protein